MSRTLLDALHDLATTRGATGPRDHVFRGLPRGSKPSTPLTRRHFDALTGRWHRHLPWAEREGVSAHWLRHTAITNIERVAGFPVAKKFAGHQHAKNAEMTITYLKAGEDHVAAAVSWITGEAHPLAPTAEDYRPDLEYLAPGQASRAAQADARAD